ncbi:MAG: ATP-dependent DNA helicase [Candidatus Heimdallarchaeota archaeon LC_2]|nr:MAG: ATP-dependent DNA helicase [Candidatus Heimdallarchaeota archaeon LC_2]
MQLKTAMNAVKEIFPYDQVRDEQAEIIEKIIKLNFHKNGSNAMIYQSPTGTGKTIAALASLMVIKKKKEKIIILTKTIAQIEPILREWKIICSKMGLDSISNYPILPVLGKNRICKNHHTDTNRINTQCMNSKISNKKAKSLLYDLNIHLLTHKQGLSSYIQFMEDLNCCSYILMQRMMSQAKIIVTTYAYIENYLFPSFLSKLRVPLKHLLVLFDEAHNLMYDKKIEIYLDDVIYCRDIIGETNLLKFLNFELNDSLPKMQKIKFKMSLFRQTKDILHEMRSNNDLINLKANLADSQLQALNRLIAFVDSIGKGSLYKFKDKIMFLDVLPSEKLHKFHQSKIQIYQSATITPLNAFQSLYGLKPGTVLLDLKEKRFDRLKFNPQQFRAYYKFSSSKKAKRNEVIFGKMANMILNIFEKSPRHILVLCPSYEYSNGIRTAIEQYAEGIIIEETAKSRSEEINLQIMQEIVKKIILGNQNGKIMEGNEWVKNKKSIISTVVLAGLLYPIPQTDQIIVNKIRNKIIRNKKIVEMFNFQIPITIRTQQAFGRCIRSEKDKGALIVLDSRADKFLQQNMYLRRYKKLSNLESDLETFFQNYDILETII